MVGVLAMLATLFLLGVVVSSYMTGDPPINSDAVGVTTVMLVAFNVFAVIAFAVSKRKTAASIAQMRPKSLREKVFELGDMTGSSYGKIAASLGTPTSMNRMGAKSYVVWSSPRYSIGLMFQGHGDDARFLTIQTERVI